MDLAWGGEKWAAALIKQILPCTASIYVLCAFRESGGQDKLTWGPCICSYLMWVPHFCMFYKYILKSESESRSVVSDSLRPHGL